MKNKLKKLVIALCSVTMLSALTGCGSFDAQGYVKASLDCATKGETAELTNYVEESEEEMKAIYDDMIASNMAMVPKDSVSEELYNNYEALFKDIYASAKYTVGEAEKVDGNYVLTVTVEPLTIFEGYTDLVAEKSQALATELTATGTEYTNDELMEMTYQVVYDAMSECAAEKTYGEPQDFEITLVRDEDKKYILSDSDQEAIGSALLDLSDIQ